MDWPEVSDLSGHIGRERVPLAIGCFEGGEWSCHFDPKCCVVMMKERLLLLYMKQWNKYAAPPVRKYAVPAAR